jgi:hypothetical protein
MTDTILMLIKGGAQGYMIELTRYAFAAGAVTMSCGSVRAGPKTGASSCARPISANFSTK